MSQPDQDVPHAPDPSPAPRRRSGRRAGLYTALALTGLVAGIVTGRLTSSSAPPQAAVRAGEVAATSTPLPSITSLTPSPSPSPSITPTPAPATTRPKPKPKPDDFSPIPADPSADPGLDFGFLTGVQKNGDLVTISFDRASFFTGERAKACNGGRVPDNDYCIENTSPTLRSFTVLAKAPLDGVSRLVTTPNGTTRQRLDAATFAANATRALATGMGVPVWLRHSDTGGQPVTSLAEQYIP